jgi:aspartyl-tRNA(Asn)/glutamyl-tRNA(Gln) amidotransferase subunit C
MDNQELYTTAELAKIEITPDDMNRLGVEITQILDYFEKMKEIDIEGLEPTTHALLRQNRVRKDTARIESCKAEIFKNILESEDNFIIIPRIL